MGINGKMLRQTVVEFSPEDLTDSGKQKLAAIYSHATGRTVEVRNIQFPDPLLIADFDLDTVAVRFHDNVTGEEL